MKPILDAATKRKLAVAASVDPRSVERVLRGERVRGMAHYRIVDALEANGIGVPLQPVVDDTPPWDDENGVYAKHPRIRLLRDDIARTLAGDAPQVRK